LERATVRQPQQDADLAELAALVRRVVSARVRDRDTVDDAVQETLVRVLEARPRLGDAALAPYAIVTAQNLVVSLARGADRQRRHLPRMIDLSEVERPEDEVVRKEEREAVAAALTTLPARDRNAVVAHEVLGLDTQTLAQELESTPGGVATRLARARATLRVEYLFALYKGKPPTPRCRPVLIALSAGDRRRQIALDAGAHLLDCSYCAALSDALMERRRSLAALLPLSVLGATVKWLKGAFAPIVELAKAAFEIPAVKYGTTAVALLISAVTVHGLVAGPPHPSATCRTAAGRLIARGKVQNWGAPSLLTHLEGRLVTACNVRVLSVPTDEGFWIGPSAPKSVWVQMTGPGESPTDVDIGRRVTFTGRVVSHSPSFAVTRKGAIVGAERLRRQGHHIAVRQGKLHVR
jgi:RNA polymerase sigma factor (sigma-70 family)